MELRSVAGRRVALRSAGEGPPAVLLHCMLAHSGALGGVMAGLAGPLRLVAMDLPGHGGTDHDPALGFQAQATANLVDLLGAIGPAHLVGHSFGATVALRVAVERPALVRSLALIEPVQFGILAEAGHPAQAEEAAASAGVAQAVGRGDWPGATEAFVARWGSGAASAAMIARMPLVWAANAELAAGPSQPVSLVALARLEMPVLLMMGASSPGVVGAILDVIAAQVPQSQRTHIEAAGHMAPLTHAVQVSAALRAFLCPEER